MNMDSLKMNLQEASSLLKAMSNEHRLTILCHLVDGEKTVRQLEELVGLRQTTLSQHLARLRYEGLVSTRREAQSIYYSLSSEQGSHLLAALHGLYCAKPGTSNHEPANFA
jgi:DNA-binding transcriptional ArsR family regulator